MVDNMKTVECFKLLKEYKYKLNKQQYKTFKGQIIAGDYDGFKKGLFRLMLKRI